MGEIPTNRCSQVHEIKMPKRLLEAWNAPTDERFVNRIQKELDAVIAACRSLSTWRFVKMKNKRVWFDREVAGLYPKLESCNMPLCKRTSSKFELANETRSNFRMDGTMFVSMNVDDIEFVMPSVWEAKKTFLRGNGNPYITSDGIIKYNQQAFRENQFVTEDYKHGTSLQTYCTNGEEDYWPGQAIILIPIHRLQEKNSGPLTFAQSVLKWLEYGLIPEGILNDGAEHFALLWQHQELFPCFEAKDDRIVFQKDLYVKSEREKKISQPDDSVSNSANAVKKALLACDKRRADLSEYPEMYVTDINKGHWELFERMREPEQGGEDCVTIELPEGAGWVARPPQMDVKENGICAIDFGTKSTVVVCQDTEPFLLRIGTGDVRKAATARDYENPTVIELRDIKGFRAAYAARSGRPFTEWEQITVSHQAENALKEQNAGSATYDAVFSELKQWANDPGRQLNLRDRKKEHLELAPYRELGADAFDPIEVYAYYLGLYINNMRHKITLDYILSFPVNYSKDVRERLLASFERGLKKSLPPAILADEECMSQFRVYAGASEPAAYAAIALKELDLEPQAAGKMTAYGVFDFGGGTTDFDFGIERIPENRRKFRYEIEQFGRGGDVHLGGENLLDLLAYEVFVQNLALMRKEGLTIVRPYDGRRVSGAETLILPPDDASQTARMNRKVLAEALRPLWEHSDGWEALKNAPISVSLFQSDGDDPKDKKTCQLTLDVPALEKLLRDRIDCGVTNFFDALLTAFSGREEQPGTIHILLAGNSCKSPIVRELFEQHRQDMTKAIADRWHVDAANTIVIHPPLGMDEEAADGKDVKSVKNRKGGMPVKNAADSAAAAESAPSAENDAAAAPAAPKSGDVPPEDPSVRLDQVITGKTGVAFGLLRSRKGGRDVRFVNRDVDTSGEAIFPYFLGDIDEADHFHVRIGKGVGYGQWAPFIYADQEDFELYYTAAASALNNTMNPGDVQMKKCRLRPEDTSDDDDVMIYIRKTTPDTIEYAAGREAEFAKEDLGDKRIYTKQL